MKTKNTFRKIFGILIVPIVVYSTDINFIKDYMNNYNKNIKTLMKKKKSNYDKLIMQREKELKSLISSAWGDDILVSSRYKSVSYSSDFKTRYVVDYKNGITFVESKADSTKKNEKKIRELTHELNNLNIQVSELLSTNNLILRNRKQKEKLESNAPKIGALINKKSKNVQFSTKNSIKISYKFSPKSKQKIEGLYAKTILKNAKRFDIQPSLVFSIIKVESAFYSRAYREDTGAIGLMQLIPKYGALDAYYRLNHKKTIFSKAYLLIPENNILLGTQYIEILRDDYLSKVKNNLSKKYLIISSYNAGIGKILRLFDKNQIKAIKKINMYSAEELFQYLQKSKKMPNETKKYLKKVLAGEDEFVYWNKNA